MLLFLSTPLVVSCGDPGHVLNAVRTSSRFTFGSKVQFQCRDGYRLEGRSELACLATRLWSHPLPRCSLVDCGDPGRSSNGQRSLVATTAFSIATYSCNRGYNLVGNRTRTCLPSGSWNGTIPDCRGREIYSTDLKLEIRNKIKTNAIIEKYVGS